MSIIGWLIFGMIAGFIASRFVNGTAEGGVLDTMLAIVGVLAGGLLLASVAPAPLGDLNIYGIFLAAIAATGVLILLDMVGRRSRAI